MNSNETQTYEEVLGCFFCRSDKKKRFLAVFSLFLPWFYDFALYLVKILLLFFCFWEFMEFMQKNGHFLSRKTRKK